MSPDLLPAETPNGLPRGYSPREVADALGFSEDWVRKQARRHTVPHMRGGNGRIRFTREQALALVGVATVQAERALPETGGLLSARSRARSRGRSA